MKKEELLKYWEFMKAPVRKIENGKAQLGTEIKIQVMLNYGEQMENSMAMALADVVLKQFGRFNLAEISLAFDMAFAGKLSIKQENLQLYGRSFAKSHLLMILGSYQKYRFPITRYIQGKLDERNERIAYEQKKKEKEQQWREVGFDKMVAEMKANETAWFEIGLRINALFPTAIEKQLIPKPDWSKETEIVEIAKRAEIGQLNRMKTQASTEEKESYRMKISELKSGLSGPITKAKAIYFWIHVLGGKLEDALKAKNATEATENQD